MPRFQILAAACAGLLAACAGQPTSRTPGVTEPVASTPVVIPPVVRATARVTDIAGVDEDAAPSYDNVWARMLANFELEGCAEHATSVQWTRWYGSRPDYMERVVARAEPWIHFIVEEIERRGLPGELALLPIVESAYDPFAYSRGRALGTWQFIADTGRRFGLQQDWWYDGRRDVWAATHAALDYLTYLNQMFDGDWLLALAAYNTGEGRVGRHVRRNASRGEGTDFWSLSLPRETRGYVPKLLGLACLFRNPDPFEFRFPETPNEPVIAAVELPSQADLVLVAQLAEVPVAELFRLNPGFNRWATSPAGPHRVVLPLDAAERVRPELAALDSDVLMQWDQVTVERGDTLLRLSERHHVPLDVIRTANGLRGDMIRAGQKLRLPRSEAFVADPLYASAANELATLQSGLIAADRVTHRVRSGESLSVIARNYRVSVRDLQRWNNLSNPNQLRAGQRLVVFHTPANAPGNSPPSQHVVQSGDSLWSISRKYSIGLDDLRRLNNLSRGATIHPGQSLKVSF